MKDCDDLYHGKNILSYAAHTVFKGSEIKAWIQFYLDHDHGSKSRAARKMREYLNVEDNEDYVLQKNNRSSSGGYEVHLVPQYR